MMAQSPKSRVLRIPRDKKPKIQAVELYKRYMKAQKMEEPIILFSKTQVQLNRAQKVTQLRIVIKMPLPIAGSSN